MLFLLLLFPQFHLSLLKLYSYFLLYKKVFKKLKESAPYLFLRQLSIYLSIKMGQTEMPPAGE